MDWASALVVVGALVAWVGLIRVILPRFGIQVG